MTYHIKGRFKETWTRTSATTLDGAKRAARLEQASHHDVMLVGEEMDGEIVVMAILPAGARARWQETAAGTYYHGGMR